MSQTRLQSFIESLINVAIGYGVAVVTQIVVLPRFGLNPSLHDNLAIGGVFTVVSIVRSYCIRRWFNARIHRLAVRVGGAA